jgi:V8-like Glu-specific endopeptidase
MRLIFFLLIVLFFSSCQNKTEPANPILTSATSSQGVIYGADNRVDLNDVSDLALKQLARSTVALFSTDQLVYDSVFDQYNFENPDLSITLCSSEKFRKQPTWAFCSGSLIEPDLILTAGHCVRDKRDCKETKFIFDYDFKTDGASMNSAPGKNVFSCREIVYTTDQKNAADFALIRLDREVIERKPLVLAAQDVQLNDHLMLIGHPAGWPTKITTNGKVRSLINDNFFVASIDSFSGNSGSSVFDESTHEIIGVLARGEVDYERQNACYVSKVCAEDSCRGEDITRVSVIRKFLSAVNKTN